MKHLSAILSFRNKGNSFLGVVGKVARAGASVLALLLVLRAQTVLAQYSQPYSPQYQQYGANNTPAPAYNNYNAPYAPNYNSPQANYNPYDYMPASYGGDYPAQNYNNQYNNMPPPNYGDPAYPTDVSQNNGGKISYSMLEVFYEKIFFDEARLLENSNGIGLRALFPIAKGFFIEFGGSYAKANADEEADKDAFNQLYGKTTSESTTSESTTDTTETSTTGEADPDDFSVNMLRANLGLGVYFPIVDNVHLIARGGALYSDYNFEYTTPEDLLDGVGWYLGPEIRLMLADRFELDIDATYEKVEEEGQLSFGGLASFYATRNLGISAKLRIIEDEIMLGIGGRWSWDR